jgi:hypothetical protein
MGDIECRVSRSNRPCLVCPGTMDLIEASTTYSFFNALPLCSSGSVNWLDCPNCGFSTTTADYQYLHMCKKQRHVIFYSSSRVGQDLPTGKSSHPIYDLGAENKDSFGHGCSSCRVKLSSGWQFCPNCGCRTEHAPAGFESISSSGSVSHLDSDGSGCSGDSGIVRMVTPPIRTISPSSSSRTNNTGTSPETWPM